MGYYTTFKLTWGPTAACKRKPNCEHDPKTPFCGICGKPAGQLGLDEVVAMFIEKNSEQFYGIGPDGKCTDAVKWYDWKDDMVKMSKEIPDVLFKLHGVGEETGDIWDAYFLNGMHQIHKARIVIDEMDPNGWK